MASGGWQFSVTVPSWTQASLEGDENIVVSGHYSHVWHQRKTSSAQLQLMSTYRIAVLQS